jgi:carbon-monoxide dehydrogenase large subunit
MGQFGISQSVTRREDSRLLTGMGCFSDDIVLDDIAHGYVLRSPFAHARIEAIDCSNARLAPGVLAVFTATDLTAAGLTDIPCLVNPPVKAGTDFIEHCQPLLAVETVRFMGDGVAFIVAETLEQAQSAAELIEIDYRPLSAVADCGRAIAADSPRVWSDAADNLAFEFEMGDKNTTEQIVGAARYVVELDVVNNRVVINALETRGAIGDYSADENKYTLYTGTQMPNGIRDQLAAVLQIQPERVRVRVNEVGGGFGAKNSLYPEQALVLHAARVLERPVKWIGDRGEAFSSDFHGRDNISHARLALDDKGRFLALQVSTLANLGAYTASRGPLSPINVHMACNTYRIPTLYIEVKGVYTHTVPTDVYRGAGRPEITYLIERLVNVAAHDLALDAIDLRRRNYIQPDAFPYTTPTGLTYDTCYFEKIMDDALQQSGWHDFESRRAQALSQGKLRGIGMANYVERCGGGGGLSEAATLRFSPDGTLTLLIGTMSNGQGHETAYSQIIHQQLGLAFEKIRLLQGDTDQIGSGLGTGGSWSIPMGGGAVWQAGEKLLESAKRIAAHVLEASEADVEFVDGIFRVSGTDVRITLDDVVQAAFDPARLPAGMTPGLSGEARFQPANHTFPHGCHICEVEIDRETGALALINYTAVHDFGRALNPLLLAGQVHGGVTQGIGQAMFERTVYDDSGQLLTGSLLDYCLPRAADLPAFDFQRRETPSPYNPLGIKGCGEAGATGSPPAVVNAITDALAPLGIRHVDMPVTSETLWNICKSH